MRGFTRDLKLILREHGCKFVHQGKGDHEIWESAINGLRFTADNNIPSRHTANGVEAKPGSKRNLGANKT